MCFQPVLLGLRISEALMYHFCLPRGRHLDICYLLCLHSFLGSQLILLYFAITQWSQGDIRGATRKAVGGGGRKRGSVGPKSFERLDHAGNPL